ncbi:MAG: peptidase M49 [Acidobacteria bacterium]|nr:peptidase M49 [Acidobacteriota bacterium]
MPRQLLLVLAISTAAAQTKPTALVERVKDTGFIQLQAPSFERLTPREKALTYWLTQAAIAIDPIIYDQQSAYGLRQKRVLEGIVSHPKGIPAPVFGKILEFTKLFWANRGNHNEMTALKFLPAFTYEELRQAGVQAIRNGAPLGTEAEFGAELAQLRPSLFDPAFEPSITAKSPRGGLDILAASSNNFYAGVSLADLKGFVERYPLNSRVEKVGGKLTEQVYRAGTPDGKIAPGYYAKYLSRAIQFLERAARAATPKQAEAIRALIRFYQTGDFNDWLAFGAAWVSDNSRVDFANGFIEVYRDARGAKGTSQAFVSLTDEHLTELMKVLAGHAMYFEEHAPWEPRYRKLNVNPPLAKAVEVVIETGDFHVGTIGDNLPNEKEIREKYGSKSFMFTASSRAIDSARGDSSLNEFAASPEEIAIVSKYGGEAEEILTALHEVIGHGSGKTNPKLTHDASYYLKEYSSTLEEARADLMALWNIFDPKLREWGLISHPDVAKAMYYNSVRTTLVQLARNPSGETIEEDHQRDRQLIAEYIRDKTGAIQTVTRNGKTYYAITSFEKMRQGVGMLLAELMRIKAEGDYAAIKKLIDRYGVRFDPKLRDQVLARYRALNLPTYFAGVNPELNATFAPGGEATIVTVSYPRDVVRQFLRYAALYEPALSDKR